MEKLLNEQQTESGDPKASALRIIPDPQPPERPSTHLLLRNTSAVMPDCPSSLLLRRVPSMASHTWEEEKLRREQQQEVMAMKPSGRRAGCCHPEGKILI